MYQLILDLLVVRVDDHAVRHALDIVLRMSGTNPDGDRRFVGVDKVADHLRQPLAGLFLDSLHAQHNRFAVKVKLRDGFHIIAQIL